MWALPPGTAHAIPVGQMLPLMLRVEAALGCRRIVLSGTVDSSTWRDLETALDRCLMGERPVVVVDVRDADYVSAPAWSRLIDWKARARKAGGDLRIEGMQPYHTAFVEHLGGWGTLAAA